MRKFLLILNVLCAIGGFGLVFYIVTQVDITTSPQNWVIVLILSLMTTVWGLFAILGYGVRWVFAQNKSIPHILWRSERQAMWLALLIGIQLVLKGFLLWNIFNASILTLAVIMLEMIFLNQESVKS